LCSGPAVLGPAVLGGSHLKEVGMCLQKSMCRALMQQVQA
jgi:hypothetical protein